MNFKKSYDNLGPSENEAQQKLMRNFIESFNELTNLNILKNEYGIDIPNHDLTTLTISL